MHTQTLLRGIIRGNDYLRRFKKYTKPVLNLNINKKILKNNNTTNKTSKIKQTVDKRKKKRRRRLSLKSINRRKWFTFRCLDRRTYTYFGERGHFIIKNFGIKIFFRRLNTLYKYLMLSTVSLKGKELNLILNIFLLIKQFARYKIKGLKFFYNKIKVKEGKGRRF